jgi:acyl-coenzyme A synthetase/AMP-(fatty) acid ligase
LGLETLPPKEIVHLKTTSATTGVPRMVAFTAQQLAADADNIVATMGLRPDWPNLGVISLAHSYGFSNLVLPLLLHGIPLVLAGSGLPEQVRTASMQFDQITIAAVPALWRAWYDAHAVPGHVKLAISAGAPLPLPLENHMYSRHQLKLHNFYGSSECGGIAYDASAVPREDAACVGTPMHNVRLKVASNGCIEVHSAAVASTYWPEPDRSLGKGRFRTKDLGEIKEDRVYLRGRTCDQINVAGRKVTPERVERVIQQHPAAAQALVFGVPRLHHGRGEVIVACVALRHPATLEEVRSFAQSHLPAWQVPREWWFVDELPANHRGKISRNEWRKRYLELKK